MKKIELMNVRKQYDEHSKEYDEAVLKVLREGKYIGGEEVALFEKEFANYVGTKYAVSCGNGTDALIIALRSLGIKNGDEVITVAFTFFATAESIAAVGATPVFVDVDKDTYCIDATLVERKITKKTRAVLAVNFYGQACDVRRLKEICRLHNIYLIMDCAQSTGTKINGDRSMCLGDVSCFSFFPTKVLGCAGDGGMIVTNIEPIAAACRSLRVHGSGADGYRTFKMFLEKKNEKLPTNIIYGESKYYNYLVGYNSRLDAIQASLLRTKLNYLDDFVRRRREHAHTYNKLLANSGYIIPFETPGTEHSYYIYALKHKNAEEIVALLESYDIASGIYYPVPLHLQGAFANLGYKKGDLPVTEELSKSLFAIPVYPELTKDEQQYIIDCLLAIIKKINK